MDWSSPFLIAVPPVLAFIGLIALLWVTHRGRADERRRLHEMTERATRLDRQGREQAKLLAHMRKENNTVRSLSLSLPNFIERLNRADLSSRDVPELVTTLAENIFQPSQVLFYRSFLGENNRRYLRLQAHRGLPETPQVIQVVPFGEGKIGWVAEHRMDKQRDEWETMTRTDGISIPSNHPLLKLDLVAPMTRNDGHDDHVLGVLCIGDPSTNPRDDKLMLQLVANLGSLALTSAQNVARYRDQANTDGLTQLLNKSYFMRRAADLLLETSQRSERLALFIFDIDHFKTYNDTNGHPAGDRLLRGLADLLRESMRPNDLCCRYGGEEFVVLMPQTDAEVAYSVAERLRQRIADTVFPHEESQPNGDLTISGGIAVYPKDGQRLEELVQHADEALYLSKRAGRNRVTRFRGVELGGGVGSELEYYSTAGES